MISRNKKAQTSMVFVFILATVIIGIIGLMGYVGINKIITNADEAARADLYNQIKSDISDLRRQRLSTRVESYKLTTPIDKVCFVEYGEDAGQKSIKLSGENDHNVFFLDATNLSVHSFDAGPIDPYYVDGISPAIAVPGICTTTSPIRLKLTGQGATTRVEEAI